jgi:uncharacterized phiE125 gp8 family phage protein
MTANAIDLATLADAKAWLNVSQIGDDALLQRLITGASEFIQQYLSRTVPTTTYTNERYNGKGGQRLMLRNWPIQSVTLVTATDQTGTVQWSYGPSYFWFDDRSIYLNTTDAFVRGLGNITVTYTAGYSTPPYGLTQACLELVALRYKERERIGLASKGLAGETTAYTVVDMPKSTKTYLDQFKNVVPV